MNKTHKMSSFASLALKHQISYKSLNHQMLGDAHSYSWDWKNKNMVNSISDSPEIPLLSKQLISTRLFTTHLHAPYLHMISYLVLMVTFINSLCGW